MSELKERIQNDMKAALRAGDKRRLGVLRLMLSSIKQREIEGRITADDTEVIAVLERMLKQRQDALGQYQAAGRQDLAEQESFEMDTLRAYMPAPLSPEELASLIDESIRATDATSPKDMGKVMASLKPRVQGRADMGRLSALVKTRLSPGL